MSFEKSLSILNDLNDELAEDVRKTGLQVLSGVIIGTPVDTGEARGAWQVTLSGKAERDTPEGRRAGQALSEGSTKIQGVTGKNIPTVTISNSKPYIEELNDGSSLQAPAKFIEMVINRVTR